VVPSEVALAHLRTLFDDTRPGNEEFCEIHIDTSCSADGRTTMTTPLVSVLVPAYNAEHTIGDTLRSALAQTWPNTEIIVVDDGSCDRTASAACSVGGDRITLIQQPNRGAAAARNRAYAACRGDLVQGLDADDLLHPMKVASQVNVLRRIGTRRTLLSGGWGWFLHRVDRAEFVPSALWHDLSPTEWLLHKMGGNLHMQTATWLVTRELTEAAGSWNTELLGDDDGEYFCRVLLASEGVKFVPEAKVYYRMAGGGRLSAIGMSDRKLKAQLASMRMHVRYLRSLEDSARVRRACSRYLANWLPHFYPNRPDLVAELQRIADEIGEALDPPKLSWKYDWLRRLFGWRFAKQAQLTLLALKWSAIRGWDKALSRLQPGHRLPMA
jgi:glycosyltransferase involved in cell wall biosynthesis